VKYLTDSLMFQHPAMVKSRPNLYQEFFNMHLKKMIG